MSNENNGPTTGDVVEIFSPSHWTEKTLLLLNTEELEKDSELCLSASALRPTLRPKNEAAAHDELHDEIIGRLAAVTIN